MGYTKEDIDNITRDFFWLFWLHGTRTWNNTSWLGAKTVKNPFDLWVTQEIIYEVKPDLIIETGTCYGGSAYFYATLCDFMEKGSIVTIDIFAYPNRPRHPRITYLTGSSIDPVIVNQVERLAAGKEVVLVDLDSNHDKYHVAQEIQHYNKLVTVGSYLIVEDTCITGAKDAAEEFLALTDAFIVDESREKFFLTFYPKGYLKRVK